MKRQFPGAHVCGITVSEAEAEAATSSLDEVLVCDLEAGLPQELLGRKFDTIIFSHVLEHLRDPASVLSSTASLLEPGGQVVVAVPNVLNWRPRLRFLLGDFRYESAGVLDSTHLRFFTFFTADEFLLAAPGPLRLEEKAVAGGVPLWILRRMILPRRVSNAIDSLGCKHFPNLFGDQILLRLIRAD